MAQLGLRIYGGNDVEDISEFPYVAQYTECGAVKISETKLIIMYTCAHCLPEDNAMNITTRKIRVGSIEINSGGEVRYVSRFLIHPDFEVTVDLNNDVAISFTDPPLNWTTKKMKRIATAQPGIDELMYSNTDSTIQEPEI